MSAVRILGLKLVLLAVSFGAVAAALPVGPEQQSLAQASWGGFKLMHLILGTAGAGSALWFIERLNTKSLGMVLTCGILSATGGTPFLSYAWTEWFAATPRPPLPVPVENLLALALGAGGLYLIPAIMGIFRALKENPFLVIDWLRGRGGPPPSPPPPPSGG